MATLTYWYCECTDDHDAYSIVAKTKKEALAKRTGRESSFEQPVKKVIDYKDAFDLFDWSSMMGRNAGSTCK